MKKSVLFTLMAVASISACTKKEAPVSQTKQSDSAPQAHEDPDGYYTCSMHPQVHQHEPGKCPICGMALIKVAGKKDTMKMDQEQTPGIQVSSSQLNIAGIGKTTVVRKDLEVAVPVSGRLISPREVAFQVYETDLQVVKSGLDFIGAASSSPGSKIRGRIRQIDTLLDPSSRTVRVIGVLEQSPSPLVIEGGFHGEIQAVLRSQLVVPEEAVLHTGEKDLVYHFAENKLMPMPVRLGRKSKDSYQVLSGVEEGDIISSGPNFLMDSEAKIRGGSSDHAHH